MRYKQTISDILQMTLGSAMIAVAFNFFILPNKMLAGGISGLAILSNYFTGISVSLLLLAYNIPIVIWAWKELRLRFIIYTVISVVLQSLFLSTLTFFSPYQNDPLLASIFGGILIGCGSGIIIRHYGSSGGTDVIAIVLRGKLGISIGTVSFIANIVVISLAGLVFGLEPAMYTLVSLFVSGQTVDFVQEGLNKKRTAMIVSDKAGEIKEGIMFQLHRGVTLMHGSGGFENQPKEVIFCVVNQFELARLKEVVHSIDPVAFMTISEASEVLGHFSEHSFRSNK